MNITCMMVLASIYISVSSSLPLTAGMKNIEIWLLFNLAYPVMVIIVNILLQVGGHCIILQEVEPNLLFQYAKDKQKTILRKRLKQKKKQKESALFTKPESDVNPSNTTKEKKTQSHILKKFWSVSS